jgi:uracil-DNA glycosylase
MLNNYIILASDYKYKSWGRMYPKYKIDLLLLIRSRDWKKVFSKYEKDLKEISENLEIILSKTKGKIEIFPYPDLVFNTFNILDFKQVNVVILGQDPYFSKQESVPQANGMSFSVPKEISIPSSLVNIYRNLHKYGHIKYIPKHGLLTFWNLQGCLLLNTSLTVQEGAKESHMEYWTDFTDKLIKELSENRDHLVFVLWGAYALKKKDLIDGKKHKFVISSHPSGLSVSKPLRTYSAFCDQDHFGKVNEYLKEFNKEPIIWQI